jgi:hypothetical protein
LHSPENSTSPASGGAKSGALDPVLTAVIDAWPELPEAIRAGILALVHAAGC